jgi:eukaryotic-like serine/threonine-protein kinase
MRRRVRVRPAPWSWLRPDARLVRTSTDLFSRFRVVRLLGGGPSGTSWLAFDADGAAVVVKRLAPALTEVTGCVARIGAEAEALSAFSHPNIAQVLGFAEVDGSSYVASAFVDGTPFRVRRLQRDLAPAEACLLVLDVLAGLGALHDHGIVHGALSSETVVIGPQGSATLVDAGQFAHTGHGLPVGVTSEYTSPEVVGGASPDNRSDVYAAGALLHDALGGGDRPVSPGSSPLRSAIGISSGLDLVVRRATARDPVFRYAGTAVFEAALRKYLGTSGRDHRVALHLAHDPTTPEVRRSRRVRSGIAVACIALFGALAGLVLWDNPAPAPRSAPAGEAPPAPAAPEGSGTSGAPPLSAVTVLTGLAGGLQEAVADHSVPEPGPAPRGNPLSCPTAEFCVALGRAAPGQAGALDPVADEVAVLAGDNSMAVTLPTDGLDPVPAADGADALELSSVSCPEPGWCVVVGRYDDVSGMRHGLLDMLAGGAWHDSSAPGGSSGSLEQVTCPAVDSCVALGTLGGVGSIWTLSAGVWTVQSAPTTGLEPASVGGYAPRLDDVSCPSPASCVAVGVYYGAHDTELGLIETLAGGRWRASAAPEPEPRPSTTANLSLQDVSCPSPGTCVAMGGYQDGPAQLHLLVETSSAGRWKSSIAPVAGLRLSATSGQWLYVDGLACPAPGSCLAAGWYFASSSSDEVRSFLLSDSGGTWRIEGTPVGHLVPPAGVGPDVVPWAVSCRAAGSCVVVGSYFGGSGEEEGVVDTLAGGEWRSATVPTVGLDPAPGTDPALELDAVACSDDAGCVALGTYRDAAGALDEVVARTGGTGGVGWTAAAPEG